MTGMTGWTYGFLPRRNKFVANVPHHVIFLFWEFIKFLGMFQQSIKKWH